MLYLPALIEALPEHPAASEDSVFARDLQARFLRALAESGSVRGAARSIGVSHQTAYRERLANPVFRRGWDAALLAARALSEEALACRAIDGVEEVVWFRGEEVGRRVRYDGRLLLAHLARLDRLTEDARTEAFADDFTAAVARYEAGSDTPEKAPAAEPAGQAPDEAAHASEISSPGQWSKRSTAPTKPCPDCGGKCLGPEAELTPTDCASYDYRIGVMYEEHPSDAPWPEDFAGFDPDAVEAAQLEAFEAGVERWWLVLPSRLGDPCGTWRYADSAAGK